MTDTKDELATIVREHQANNNGFYAGRADLDYWAHDDGVTIHGGFGGSARDWARIAPGLARAASHLSEGAVTFTPLGGRVVGDLAYVAGMEESTVRVDGGAPQRMRMRVTTVLQRIDGRWRCVHRHGEIVQAEAGA
jgi:SnoaL-like protein